MQIFRKNKFIIIIFCFLITYIVSLILIRHYYRQKINQLTGEKKQCKNQLTSRENSPTLDLNDIFLLAQKAKSSSAISADKMFFAVKPSKLDDSRWRLDIFLEGTAQSGADAADLQLNLENLETVSIIDGNAFPLYPRKISKNDYVLITGLASIKENAITFGRAGRLFSSIVVQKKQRQNKAMIKVEPANTKIFFSAENKLDEKRTFTSLEL